MLKKVVKSKLLSEIHRDQSEQELKVHIALHHANIVKAYEQMETTKEFVLVLEHMNEPEYFRNKLEVLHKPIKNETKIKFYTESILKGLDYLHSNNIIHCDIKPDNILRHKKEKKTFGTIKIADFGLAHFKDPITGKATMLSKCGSFGYLSPETASDALVDDKIDIWAVGVILYQMAVGYKPTAVQNFKYGSGPIPFRKVEWKKRSPELQDLIVKMLEIDPAVRISAREALKHPWFTAPEVQQQQ